MRRLSTLLALSLAACSSAPGRVTVTGDCSGAAVVSDDGVAYRCDGVCPLPNRPVPVHGEAPAHCAFLGFGGACEGEGPCTVGPSSKSLTAGFVASRTLRFSFAGRPGDGAVLSVDGKDDATCAHGCERTVLPGSTVHITPVGTPLATFSWGGACASAAAECTFTMTGDADASLVMGDRTTKLLTLVRAGEGTVSIDPLGLTCADAQCTIGVEAGTEVWLTARAAAGSAFRGWSLPDCFDVVCRFIVRQDMTVSSRFVAQRELSLSVTGSGTVDFGGLAQSCDGGCTRTFDDGTVVGLRATPAEDARLIGFSFDCSGFTCGLTMSQARNVGVEFKRAYGPLESLPEGLSLKDVAVADDGAALVVAGFVTSTASLRGVTIPAPADSPLDVVVARLTPDGGVAWLTRGKGRDGGGGGLEQRVVVRRSGDVVVSTSVVGTVALPGQPPITAVPMVSTYAVAELDPAGQVTASLQASGRQLELRALQRTADDTVLITLAVGGTATFGGTVLQGPDAGFDTFLVELGPRLAEVRSQRLAAGAGTALGSVFPASDGGYLAVARFSSAADFGCGPVPHPVAPLNQTLFVAQFDAELHCMRSRGVISTPNGGPLTPRSAIELPGGRWVLGAFLGIGGTSVFDGVVDAPGASTLSLLSFDDGNHLLWSKNVFAPAALSSDYAGPVAYAYDAPSGLLYATTAMVGGHIGFPDQPALDGQCPTSTSMRTQTGVVAIRASDRAPAWATCWGSTTTFTFAGAHPYALRSTPMGVLALIDAQWDTRIGGRVVWPSGSRLDEFNHTALVWLTP